MRCLQVQDYYLHLRRKDITKILPALYRLQLACVMLKHSKSPHRGESHHYPKLILANLCILAYWTNTNYIGMRMMDSNISVVNEELGEMTFSMLARCVLGDHHKFSVDHMNDMYQLLPVYRDLRNDVSSDVHSTSSISWRNTIDPEGNDVAAVAHFFRQRIAEVLRLNFTSYDGSPGCYKSRQASASHLTSDVTPLVYLPDVLDHFPGLFEDITRDVNGFFLHPYTNIWPHDNAVPNNVNAGNYSDANDSDDTQSLNEQEQKEQPVIHQWGADWEKCSVGCMAISRVVWPDGKKGVAVHKVRTVAENVMVSGGVHYHRFSGKEYVCTKDVWDEACLSTGKWWVRAGSSVADSDVMSYDVIAYFPGLLSGGKLPAAAIREARDQHQRSPLFHG